MNEFLRNSVQTICAILIILSTANALFEDQVGKFDWQRQHIGFIDNSHQPIGSGNRLVVSSSENVVASIDLLTRQIAWRKVLEANEIGNIDHIVWFEHESVIISKHGRRVRALRYADGLEVWQLAAPSTSSQSQDASLKHTQIVQNRFDPRTIHILNDDLLWSVSSYGELLWSIEIPTKSTLKNLFLFATSNHVLVGSVDSNSNQLHVSFYSKQNGSHAGKVTIPWSFNINDSQRNCVTANNLLFCSYQNELLTLNIPLTADDTNVPTNRLSVSNKINHVKILDETSTETIISVKFDNFKTNIYQFTRKDSTNKLWDYVELNNHIKGDVTLTTMSNKNSPKKQVLGASSDEQKINFDIFDVHEKSLTHLRSYKVELPEKMGQIEYLAYSTVRNIQVVTIRMQDGSLLVVKLTENSAELILHRDEALSSIIAVETFDLSLSIGQVHIEEEFGGTDVLSMFSKRISSQISQLKDFLNYLIDMFIHGHQNHAYTDQQAALVRDEFNLNKILIAVTSVGKVFGILTQGGSILWKHYYNDFLPFENFDSNVVPLFHIRSAAHYTHQPLASIVYRSRASVHQVSVRTFNPYTGEIDESSSTSSLPYRVKRVFLSSQTGDDFRKVLLFVDTNNRVHTYPQVPLSKALSTKTPTYIYLFDKNDQVFYGYYVSVNDDSQETSTSLREVWRVVFQHEQVKNIYTRLASDRVHSAGIVLGDRTVLYKYVNPNLIAVVTEGVDFQKVPFVNIYLLDTVTGSIKLSQTHKRAKMPVHLVLAENWIVYTYYNQRYRRYEAISTSLFEGPAQYNYSAFSSFDPIEPVAQSKGYILQYGVNAIQVTTTEKGITSRDIIMATPNGMLIEIPWLLFDPRRPLEPTQMDREEGLIPYAPEIIVNFESVINYYKYVHNIRAIHTAATGLESTSVVFAYGLDLFCTRVFPSRIFDQLKDDFDFMFIGWSTVAFVVGSFIAKHFAAKHQTKKAWK